MSFRGALKRLTSVRYLRDSKGGESSLALGENGALLRIVVESRMRQEVTRGQLVTGVTVGHVVGQPHQLVTEKVQNALNERIEEGMKDDAIFNVNLEISDPDRTPAAVDEFSFEVTENEEGKNDIHAAESEAPRRMISFFLEEQWKYVYHDFLRSRRKFWKRYLFNPWSVQVVRADATTDHPSARISWTFEDQPHYQLQKPLLLERVQVGRLEDLGLQQPRKKVKVVETTSMVGSGCAALLLDSVRKRLFLEDNRLALHKAVAPFQTSVMVVTAEQPSPELLDLREMVTLLAQEKGITVYNEADSFAAADALGIPYTVVLDEESLTRGVVRFRDRETCCFEEIHLAFVAKRLVHIFKGEIVPQNTWEEMQGEEGATEVLKVTKKRG